MRILCYSPYNLWTLHGLWEMTVLHAATLRGADVRYVMCDGLYPECDVFWASTNPRDQLSCVRCQAHVARLAQEMCMPYEWLGRYVSPDELRRARDWALACPPDGYASARYEQWSIGEWVRSSVHSHLRVSTLDLENPELRDVYRAYLQGGLVACFALERLLEELRPDLLFLFSGRMGSTRIALELARRRGIRVVCHERGLLRESLKLFENEDSLALEPIRALWDGWGAVPLTTPEQERIVHYMQERALGQNVGERTFSPPPQPAAHIRSELGLRHGHPLWLLFTSSEDEVIANQARKGPFERQIDWIHRTVDYARAHPEIDLVIRIHPNIGSARSIGRNEGQLRELETLRTGAPANVHVVWPDDPVSSYTLMELADVGFVYISITGLEMACRGVPVVVAAGAWIRDLPFAVTVRAADAYADDLDRLRLETPGTRSHEVARLAHRFAYALYFRWNIAFPLVRMPDAHNGVLRYDSLEALLPGRDPGLDRICRILLEGEPICAGPDPEQRARPEASESTWLETRWTPVARLAPASPEPTRELPVVGAGTR